MRNKILPILKKTLKAILWVVVIFVLLFLIVAAIIQIPYVQTKIVQRATTFVSSKTHTLVKIDHVSIGFPKTVVVKGLFLEDLKKDTLIYAGVTKINIVLKDLLANKICINNVSFQDLKLNIYSTNSDSLFNYNFLITSFADSTKTETVKTPAKWTFSIDNIDLKNIQLRYNDVYGGMKVLASLDNLTLNVDKMDLSKASYNIDNLLVDNLQVKILTLPSKKTKQEQSDNALPFVSAHNIEINNSAFTYSDSNTKQIVSTKITSFILEEGTLDLQKELLDVEKIQLSNTAIQYSSVLAPTVKANELKNASTVKSDWKISVKQVAIKNNSLAYSVANTPLIKNSFDINHLNLKYFNLDAKDITYSETNTNANILKFNAIDRNKFIITKFVTNFSMDKHSITANKLQIRTTNSTIDADVKIKFDALQSINKNISNLALSVNMHKVSVKNSDILYFNPSLAKLDFFKSKQNVTAIYGMINGRVNNLVGKRILIKTGENTFIASDFNIKGLPSIKTATFYFPSLKMKTTRSDLRKMAGSYIPKNIELPNEMSVIANFKGSIKSFESKVNFSSSFGELIANGSMDTQENYTASVRVKSFDLGQLMKNRNMYGPISLTAEINGIGLLPESTKANIKATATEIYFNKYLYHNLKIDGKVNGREFAGKVNLNDKNAQFDFDGLVNMTAKKELFNFHLKVQGVDLQKLNFTKNDVRVGLKASANLKGGSIDKLNGTAAISNLVVTQNGKKYALDSVLMASINEPNKNKFDFRSALIGLKYNGTISLNSLPTAINQFFNKYFPFGKTAIDTKNKIEPSNFNFEIELHNHPILSEVLLPQLREFEPGSIIGSFDSKKNELKLNASINKIVYGTTEINNLDLAIHADSAALDYKLSSTSIGNSQMKLPNLLLNGKIADNIIVSNLSSIDDNKNKRLTLQTQIIKNKTNFKLSLIPNNLYINNKRWDIAEDNYLEFGKQGFLIHHLFMNNGLSQLNIASVNDNFNDDLNIAIKNFKLEDISKLIEKDSSLVKGDVNGNVLLKRVNTNYGLIADATISNLVVRNVPIGNLTFKGENPTTQKFDVAIKLTGNDNNLTANGTFKPNGGDNALDIKTKIQSLSMKTVEAFSMGQITDAAGAISGNFSITGNTNTPKINGELTFDNVFVNPTFLNNRYELKHETIQLNDEGIYFKNFTMVDAKQHKAIIDGKVLMKNFTDFQFAMHIDSKDFLLFNTTIKDNKIFYGRMVIDSRIDVNGPMALPIINAKIKMKKGSNFTFAVPEDKVSTDKGEDIVEFNEAQNSNSILYRKEKKVIKNSGLTGYDLSSIIEVDKEATLRLLMDPTSTDSLVVRGDAALSFTMDRSGKMSLTGAYNLNEGSYLISIESIIKRKFEIIPGSTIIWNGDPLDADITLNATYTVRAAPFDLVADQMVGLSAIEQGGYKQLYPFIVNLKMRGAILKPEISFEIQLQPENKGILGGAVNQKLLMLNDDPSLLNKQVFALLVLGRFVQENPLQTESGGSSTLLRSTVSNFLSAQLNQISSKIIPGMSLNFDIQSYNDFQSGQAQGRTQVEIGLKQQLFNQRLTVQLGGSVDVEGQKAKQNSTSEITSDVTVEYKLTEDGRYRLTGFRHNLYDGAIEGQLVETGAGVVYVRDFENWKDFLAKPNKVKNKKITPRNQKNEKDIIVAPKQLLEK